MLLKGKGDNVFGIGATEKTKHPLCPIHFCHEGVGVEFLKFRNCYKSARGSVVLKAQAGRSLVPDPTRSMNFSNFPNPFGRSRPWGSLNF
jgi:hypothetical protein